MDPNEFARREIGRASPEGDPSRPVPTTHTFVNMRSSVAKKASQSPSGLHWRPRDGLKGGRQSWAVASTVSRPLSTSTTTRSRPSRARAMFVPSGDHTGVASGAAPEVRRRSLRVVKS